MSFLSALNIPIKLAFVIPAIIVAWTIIIGGPVQEMPFGTQEATETIADIMATLNASMPWFQPLFEVFVIGIQVKLALLLYDLIFKVISIFIQN